MTSACAQVLAWGVDAPTHRKVDAESVFKLLYARGITQYRLNAYLADVTDAYQVQRYREKIKLAKIDHID